MNLILLLIALLFFSLGVFVGRNSGPVDTELVIKPFGKTEMDLKKIELSNGKIIRIKIRYELYEDNTENRK